MSLTMTPEAENDRIALHRKMDAEIAKLIAETAKINRETRSYPWLPIATALIGSSGFMGAAVALLVAFHK